MFPTPYVRETSSVMSEPFPNHDLMRSRLSRIPTPEKSVIESMAGSEARRTLGRRQRLLKDISKRCREQEVSDLSQSLTQKFTLADFQREREPSYLSAQMQHSQYMRKPSQIGGIRAAKSMERLQQSKHAVFGLERGNTCFPIRRPNRRLEKTAVDKYTLPKAVNLRLTYRKGVMPFETTNKSRLVFSQTINGPIQLNLYTQERDAVAPLSLPGISVATSTSGAIMTSQDRADAYMRARGMLPREDGRRKSLKQYDWSRELTQVPMSIYPIGPSVPSESGQSMSAPAKQSRNPVK